MIIRSVVVGFHKIDLDEEIEIVKSYDLEWMDLAEDDDIADYHLAGERIFEYLEARKTC